MILTQRMKYKDHNVNIKDGICIWNEEISRVRIIDNSGCIQNQNININPSNYMSGENIFITVQYNNSVEHLPMNPYNYIRWNKAVGNVPYPFNGTKPLNESERAIECTGLFNNSSENG